MPSMPGRRLVAFWGRWLEDGLWVAAIGLRPAACDCLAAFDDCCAPVAIGLRSVIAPLSVGRDLR